MRSLVNQAKKNLYTSASASQSATMNSINFHHYQGIESAFAPHTHSLIHMNMSMDFIHFCVSMRTLREHTYKSVRWLLLLLCQMWWFCLSLLCHNKAHKSCNHHTDTQKLTHTNPRTLTHPHAFDKKANTHANVACSIRKTRTFTLTLAQASKQTHTVVMSMWKW